MVTTGIETAGRSPKIMLDAGIRASQPRDTSVYGTFAPKECVVAVIDGYEDAERAATAVLSAGWTPGAVRIMRARSAVASAWALKWSTRSRLKRMVASFVRTLSQEDEQQDAYLAAARRDTWLIVAEARHWAEVERACGMLLDHRAHDLAYYGAHGTIETLGG